ncbi:hypothetical protein TrVE_jg2562 [Triparma verrucosa]|uniref:Uncharacterized protein n=1 Tax=Triparma verrucosa TaxID=1606542 RepID=A0A9W7KVS9_9STRA|nr:hypothetical protein TrVE_jg2562 [Triparma verrucosa]
MSQSLKSTSIQIPLNRLSTTDIFNPGITASVSLPHTHPSHPNCLLTSHISGHLFLHHSPKFTPTLLISGTSKTSFNNMVVLENRVFASAPGFFMEINLKSRTYEQITQLTKYPVLLQATATVTPTPNSSSSSSSPAEGTSTKEPTPLGDSSASQPSVPKLYVTNYNKTTIYTLLTPLSPLTPSKTFTTPLPSSHYLTSTSLSPSLFTTSSTSGTLNFYTPSGTLSRPRYTHKSSLTSRTGHTSNAYITATVVKGNVIWIADTRGYITVLKDFEYVSEILPGKPLPFTCGLLLDSSVIFSSSEGLLVKVSLKGSQIISKKYRPSRTSITSLTPLPTGLLICDSNASFYILKSLQNLNQGTRLRVNLPKGFSTFNSGHITYLTDSSTLTTSDISSYGSSKITINLNEDTNISSVDGNKSHVVYCGDFGVRVGTINDGDINWVRHDDFVAEAYKVKLFNDILIVCYKDKDVGWYNLKEGVEEVKTMEFEEFWDDVAVASEEKCALRNYNCVVEVEGEDVRRLPITDLVHFMYTGEESLLVVGESNEFGFFKDGEVDEWSKEVKEGGVEMPEEWRGVKDGVWGGGEEKEGVIWMMFRQMFCRIDLNSPIPTEVPHRPKDSMISKSKSPSTSKKRKASTLANKNFTMVHNFRDVVVAGWKGGELWVVEWKGGKGRERDIYGAG